MHCLASAAIVHGQVFMCYNAQTMSPSGEATQADCSEGQAVAHNEERRALCGGDDGHLRDQLQHDAQTTKQLERGSLWAVL